MLAGTKKCSPTHPVGALRPSRQLVDVERRGVRREDRVRLRDARRVCERPRALRPYLSKTASTMTSAPASSFQSSVNAIDCAALPRLFLRQPSLLHLIHEHAHDRLARLVDGFVVAVDDDDRNAGLRERDRDAAAHRPGADDARRRATVMRHRARGKAGDLRQLSFRKKEVPQRRRGLRANELVEEPRLAREAERRKSARRRPARRRSACARRIRRSLPAAPSCALARRRTARLAAGMPGAIVASRAEIRRFCAFRKALRRCSATSPGDDLVDDAQLCSASRVARSNP